MPESESLRRFGAHQKAIALFDWVVADLAPLIHEPALQRLISQQYASADSIAANIEEGYGRSSKREYAQFLIIARGSAQETRGRYERMKHWLPPEVIGLRISLCNEIIAILTTTIKTLRDQDKR
ncbi:MAG: four helix bundle protein [Lacunisphaera sp.]|nr:four helix bundle protein [Lacunisphaera sp.]